MDAALSRAQNGRNGEPEALIQAADEIGARVRQRELTAAAARYEAAPSCPACGRGMLRHDRVRRPVLGLPGPLSGEFQRWRCRRCRRATCPALARLGLRHGCERRLVRVAAKLCAHEAFELAEAVLAEFGLPLSDHTLQRLAHEVGGERVSVLATLTDCRGLAAWVTAELARWNVAEAAEVVVLGAVAEWIWEHVAQVVPHWVKRVEILDWYHLCEHLATAAGGAQAAYERLQDSAWVGDTNRLSAPDGLSKPAGRRIHGGQRGGGEPLPAVRSPGEVGGHELDRGGAGRGVALVGRRPDRPGVALGRGGIVPRP